MTEALALALLYLAACGLYVTAEVRSRPVAPAVASAGRRWSIRVLSLVAIASVLALWRRIEGAPAPVLLAVTGMMVSGTTVALLGALWPRGLLGSALFAIASLPLLLFAGAVP